MKMKRSEQKLIVFMLITIVLMFINFITHTLVSSLSHLILVFSLLILSKFLFGFEKNKLFNKNKLIKYFVLFLISSMIFIYAIGLVSGFLTSPYNRSFMGIIKNAGWLFLFYISLELLRYNLVKKGEKNKLIFFLIILAFSLVEISLGLFMYNLKVKTEILKFLTILVVPIITKNVVLTSFSNKYGYEVTIIYQLIVNLYYYIMPIYPGFDYFLTSIVNFMQPVLVWALCKTIFDKKEKEDLRSKHIVSKTVGIISVFFAILIIALFSNLFRYWIAVIGTGSMTPTINIGDIIVVDKAISKTPEKLKVGDVLVFEEENKIYTHRIIEMEENNGNVKIITKGDRKGNAVDSWVVTNKEIVGIVKFKISYVGYPTVWLNRMIREK